LGFNDHEIVSGVPNEILPFVVIATMANHDFLRILINEWGSCHIMYEEPFTKLGVRNEETEVNIIYVNILARIQWFHIPSLWFVELLFVFDKELIEDCERPFLSRPMQIRLQPHFGETNSRVLKSSTIYCSSQNMVS